MQKNTPASPLFLQVAFLALALGLLAACGGKKVASEAEFPDKTKQEMYKQGSLTSDQGGVQLFGGEKTKEGAGGITVNAYLWRGALDTVAFMPLASADPFGGTILTDWHSPPGHPLERMKLNVFILDRELRADGVRVKVFKQTRADSRAGWADIDVAPDVATKLEETILTRARQMKMAQKQKTEK